MVSGCHDGFSSIMWGPYRSYKSYKWSSRIWYIKDIIYILRHIVSLYRKTWQRTCYKFLVGLMDSQSAVWVLMWPQECLILLLWKQSSISKNPCYRLHFLFSMAKLKIFQFSTLQPISRHQKIQNIPSSFGYNQLIRAMLSCYFKEFCSFQLFTNWVIIP